MKFLCVVHGEENIARVKRCVKEVADGFASVTYRDHEPPDLQGDLKDIEIECSWWEVGQVVAAVHRAVHAGGAP